jgi:ribonucleotide monophosphatase NagD (HAD superfamily)
MVGDTLDTDIEFGNASGVTTVLVLSGNTSAEAGAGAVGAQQPTLMIDSVADLNGAKWMKPKI